MTQTPGNRPDLTETFFTYMPPRKRRRELLDGEAPEYDDFGLEYDGPELYDGN